MCSASTREWAIAKFLYSNTDVAAVTAVGKVLGMYKQIRVILRNCGPPILNDDNKTSLNLT